MRIPIPLVILLCLAVVGTVWWSGTRKHDFLTPPPSLTPVDARGTAESNRVDAKQPDQETPEPPGSGQAEDLPPPPPPVPPPTLSDWSDMAATDPSRLMQQATELEQSGDLQRALAACERIIDSTTAEDLRPAIEAVLRLRSSLPEWNQDPSKALPITLHAGTGRRTAERLAPVLDQIAAELRRASSGILKVTASVASGPDIPDQERPAPVAIWLAGPTSESPSTEVRSFTTAPNDDLHHDVLQTVLELVRGHFNGSQIRVPASQTGGAPLDQIRGQITRLAWHELGTHLQ